MARARLHRLIALSALWVALAAQTSHAAPVTPDPPLKDADYFAFADQVVNQMERYWNPGRGYYRTGARSIDTICSAAMLTILATSAAHGHVGPARNDERARILVKSLTAAPPFFTAARPPHYDKMFHSPGWTSNMDGEYVDMDKSIDPKVAEGLQIAYRARQQLNLPADDAARIRTEIHQVAFTEFFRYPKVRLNQINWHAELYAYDWLVNDDPTLLRDDYRQHMHAFTQGFKVPQIAGGATNVGPSYRFIYQSNTDPAYSRNIDSAEYANMTLHFIYWYDLARQSAGMAPLSGEDLRLLRGWTQRDLYGYWTHAGFMNWDTGWSYERWMKGKAWAYGQQGLLAIATSPQFQTRAREARWAKYLFDRGLRLYEHLSYQQGSRGPFRPSAQLFHIGDQGTPASTMFWARMGANAVRAVSAGMGRMPAEEPPSFYSYDADIGRLAVSTRHYSTAILADNRGKVPYGGNELARFYDSDGDPIGGTGGHPPMAFGVRVEDHKGERLMISQRPIHSDPRRPPLTLTRSPRGRVAHQRVLASRPDAGPFERLSVTGRKADNGVSVTSSYDFRDRSIGARWTIRRPHARRVARAAVLFPTWGKLTRLEAVLRGGRTVVARDGLDTARVRFFRLRGEYGAYRVMLPARTAGRVRIFPARRQKANPRGGPTLAVQLPGFTRGTRQLAVTLVPTGSGGMVGDPEDGPAPAYALP